MAITTLMFVGARRVNYLRIKFQWACWNDSYPTVMVLRAMTQSRLPNEDKCGKTHAIARMRS
jgi:hypothetical protein